MANQAIALQARAPQSSILGPSIQRAGQMTNMMAQQRAAEREAAIKQQQMDIEAAKEARGIETHTAEMRAKGQAYRDAEVKRLRNMATGILESGSEPAYQAWVKKIEAVDQDLAETIRTVAPTFNYDVVAAVVSVADDYLGDVYPTPVASLQFTEPTAEDPVSRGASVVIGGRPRARGVTILGERVAPRATPTAPIAPIDRSMDEPPAMEVADEGTPPPLSPFQREHLEKLQNDLGMTQEASFTQGRGAAPITPDVAQNIYDSAIATGVMAQVDFDQLLAMAPPQNRQSFIDLIQRNNITLEPNAPSLAASGAQTPQLDFAVLRGPPPQLRTAALGDQPDMRQTMLQSNETRPIALKRPTPPTANVPIERVRQEGAARRESPQEVYLKEKAKIDAQRAAGPAPPTRQQRAARRAEVTKALTQTQSLINKTYDPKEGVIALARKIKMLSPDQKESITGYSTYIPSFRESSKEADTLFGNLKGVITAAGKDAAAASGAIGPMAVQEWKIVADQIATLDLASMTPRALDAQMDRIIRQVSNATNLAQRMYDVQYGDDIQEYPEFRLRGVPSAGAKTPVVKNKSRISPDVENILKSQGL